jgi:hypothetical protein
MASGDPIDEFAENRFIKVMRGAPAHRKFRKLSRELEVSKFEALGVTVALWEWIDANRPFGKIDGFTADDLADSLGIEHIDPDRLLAAWISVGLVDDSGDGSLSVHGWLREHRTGASAQQRSEGARRSAYTRYHKSGDHDENPHPECHLCPEVASEHASLHASEQSEARQEAALQVLDVDARRKTQDARRKTLKIAPKEEKTRAYANDDPERPFPISDKAAAQ